MIDDCRRSSPRAESIVLLNPSTSSCAKMSGPRISPDVQRECFAYASEHEWDPSWPTERAHYLASISYCQYMKITGSPALDGVILQSLLLILLVMANQDRAAYCLMIFSLECYLTWSLAALAAHNITPSTPRPASPRRTKWGRSPLAGSVMNRASPWNALSPSLPFPSVPPESGDQKSI
jgi:hypothetical protein